MMYWSSLQISKCQEIHSKESIPRADPLPVLTKALPSPPVPWGVVDRSQTCPPNFKQNYNHRGGQRLYYLTPRGPNVHLQDSIQNPHVQRKGTSWVPHRCFQAQGILEVWGVGRGGRVKERRSSNLNLAFIAAQKNAKKCKWKFSAVMGEIKAQGPRLIFQTVGHTAKLSPFIYV